MQLHFQTFGTGAPLIVLHGLFGSADNWVPIARRLAPHFQVFLLDQRNHGRSPHAEEMSYPIMAEDVNRWMAVRDLASAHVMGHSMGGKTAMQFALGFPSLVKRLVVVDIGPQEYEPRHVEILEALSALPLQAFSSRSQIEQALEPAIPELPLRQFLLKSVDRDSTGKFRWRMGLAQIQKNYPRILHRVTGETAFTGPVLFVRGECSDYLAAGDMHTARQLFPRATLETIPGTGHWVHAENAPEFFGVVSRFLLAPEADLCRV
jgi:pimeloyl-ACP methyl ester carboxylesterase